MHFIGRHFDGFSYDLLGWQIDITADTADVKARWFVWGGGEHGMTLSVARADLPSEDDLRAATLFKPHYPSEFDDVGSIHVTVLNGDEVLASTIDGGTELDEHPELKRFLPVWNQIDDVVMKALEASGFIRAPLKHDTPSWLERWFSWLGVRR